MNTRSIPVDGKALKTARAASFLTQLELATQAGTTATTVYRLETARQKCTLRLLAKLGKVLRVDPISLVEESARHNFKTEN